jgi:phosphatidylglycerol:prolipoprotein diacylglycerol transferase
MLDLLTLLTIEIGIDPEITEFGGLLLTWHGVFTALGIAVGVYVAVMLARRDGFVDDDVYSVALIAIPCGIIGARALYVLENWGDSNLDNVIDIFRINEGGISIWGAIIGGVLGAIIYLLIRGYPVLRALDIGVIGLLVGMAIGRVGDIINGEHFAEVSSLPWAVRYTHINSPSVLAHPDCGLGVQPGIETSNLCAQHPAVAYEMLGDLLIVGLLLIIIAYVRRDGVAFFTAAFLYSAMRFGVSELRLDSDEVIWGLTTPQVTSLVMIVVAAIGLIWCWRRADEDDAREPASGAPMAATGPPAT